MCELAPTWPSWFGQPCPRKAVDGAGEGDAGRASEVQNDQGDPMNISQTLTVENAVSDSFGLGDGKPSSSRTKKLAERETGSSAKNVG